MRTSGLLRTLAATAAIVMVAVACGSDGGDEGAEPAATADDTADDTDDDGADGDDASATESEGDQGDASAEDGDGSGAASDEVVEASRDEGPLVVYGNPPEAAWEAIVAGFNELYPWIEVQPTDLGAAEASQRYLSEASTDTQTADLLVASDATVWLDLIDRGEVVDYSSPVLDELPDSALLAPGVHAMSLDPVIFLYNTQLLGEDEVPTTMAEMAELAGSYDDQLTTYVVSDDLAYMSTYTWLNAAGGDFATLETILGATSPEDSGGTMLQKIGRGSTSPGSSSPGSPGRSSSRSASRTSSTGPTWPTARR